MHEYISYSLQSLYEIIILYMYNNICGLNISQQKYLQTWSFRENLKKLFMSILRHMVIYMYIDITKYRTYAYAHSAIYFVLFYWFAEQMYMYNMYSCRLHERHIHLICIENLYGFSISSSICRHACDFTVCDWHVKQLSELTTHIVHSNCDKVSNCCADLTTCLCVCGQSWAPCMVRSTRLRCAERTHELATAANHWHMA